jgi:tRNA pseudouridine38-40 synthase
MDSNSNKNQEKNIENQSITKPISLEENNNTNKEENNNKYLDEKKEKIKLPKRKYAIIHGYIGINYSGNQKNPGVKTIEEELENALFKCGFISPCNYGKIQKIDWMRASRTDKGVSAIMNVVSCRLHKYPDLNENEMKLKVNLELPKDIKIFRFIEVSEHFDSKSNNNNREYNYVIPSFLFEPIINKNDKENKIEMKDFVGNYSFKLNDELKEKLNKLCKNYCGTKKYHNYTKNVGFSSMQSQRHIYKFEYEFDNLESKFEVIKFIIIGQSFLYNQIRKMIGMIINCMRDNLDFEYFENSFLSNKVDIPKAPAEGLFLRRIDYSKYNDRKLNKKNNIFITSEDEIEMDNFEKILRQKTVDFEQKEKVFSNWLWKFDNQRNLII